MIFASYDEFRAYYDPRMGKPGEPDWGDEASMAFEAGRNAALEAAAKVAEAEYANRSKGAEVRHKASADIAAAIRKLKEDGK